MAKKKSYEELLKEMTERKPPEETEEKKQRVNCPFFSKCVEKKCEECDA